MPQKIIPLVENELYHVFNRGVDKRDVFLDKEDYLRFYQSLHLFNSVEAVINFDAAVVKAKNNVSTLDKLVEISAYSLLQNHFHLIIRQEVEGGISEFMRRISLGYTSYFNQKNDRSGILFQGNFKRVHIDSDEQLNYLFAYVNENHFVHNVIMEREICHSSSLHYQGLSTSKLIKKNQENYKYDFTENIELAKSIFEKRKSIKADKILFD